MRAAEVAPCLRILDSACGKVDRGIEQLDAFIRRSQGKPMADKPQQHFSGLVAGLREQVKDAVGRARSLKERGAKSLDGFAAATRALHNVYDEVDAATAEINGTLLGQGDNGGPAVADDVKNSSAPSGAPAGSSEDTRASNFSDLHPSQRVQTGLEPSGTR